MNKKYKKSLVWIRRDLRLLDHAALSHATKQSEQVAVAFIFDTQILKQLGNKKDKRVTFIYDSLLEVDAELRKQGSRLIVRIGDPVNEIPKIIKELGVEALYCNEDYEPYAIKRDKKVKNKLNDDSTPSYFLKDQVIFSANEVLKKDQTPYQMFTPYKRIWLKQLRAETYKVQNVGKNFMQFASANSLSQDCSLESLGFERTEFYYDFQKPGRKNAIKHLKKFSESIKQYKDHRDYPNIKGTSGLSVHLRFGTISIRECVRMSLKFKSPGSETWLSELIWRDFYQMILFQFPYVVDQAFKKKYQDIKWKGSQKNFKLWCEGKTGYPIVDAAMRQLNETGWMHNRLRMIVASFLTKDLLVDWRKGEAFFAEKLLEFDLASNNGGWQWGASTGCDAQPYFRVFNPELQSRKFDSDGGFLREWLPELKDCSNKDIHCPENVSAYPEEIVDHQVQKLAAIQMFKAMP